jgi:hypothetical protein
MLTLETGGQHRVEQQQELITKRYRPAVDAKGMKRLSHLFRLALFG